MFSRQWVKSCVSKTLPDWVWASNAPVPGAYQTALTGPEAAPASPAEIVVPAMDFQCASAVCTCGEACAKHVVAAKQARDAIRLLA